MLCKLTVYGRSIVAVLLASAICIATLAPICATPRSLPDCCTKHGCKMPKRIAKRCAFASCDRQIAVSLVKTVPAIIVDRLSHFIEPESQVTLRLTAHKLTPHTSDIDHPPRA